MNGALKLGAMSLLLAFSAGTGAHADGKHNDKGDKYFNRIATFPVHLNGNLLAEIVAASEDGKTLVYTDAPGGSVGFVDIKDPSEPKADGKIDVDGEPTSVAVVGKYALVAVDTSANFVDTSGVLLVIDIKDRSIVESLDLGGQPDCVAVSPDGCYAAIAIENERDEDVNDGELPQFPAGFLAVIRLKGKPADWEVETVDLTGLADDGFAPQDPEPEFVSINKKNIAAITLQENNHIVLVDLECLEVVRHFSAGAVDLDEIDTVEEDAARISLDGSLEDVLREPDAVKWIDSDCLMTANEGDLAGGSRGFTIFDTCGDVVYDSDNRFEHLAARHGHYPESRSENKGSEPEGVEIAKFGSDQFAFVGSERGNFIAVFKMDDCKPRYWQLLPTTPGPEGLVAIPNRKLFVASSEFDDVVEGENLGLRSTLSIYRLENEDPVYPHILSGDDENGLPIPWGALSALAADRSKSHILYAVTDSYYLGAPRILKIDVSYEPARIVKEILITDEEGNIPAYDLEGIVQREDGSFWVCSEGNTADGDEELFNLLVHVGKDGVVQQEIPLPPAVEAKKTSNGFEGVTVVYDGDEEIVYVAIQREWAGDGSGNIRLAEYRPAEDDPSDDSDGWRFFYYPKSAPTSPAGGSVGLSEIVAVSKHKFAIIERDNQRGPNATIKWITEVSIKGITPVAEGGTFPKLEKKLVLDVLPLLNSTNGWTQDKLEGLAISCKGKAYIVTDNDGVDESTGETQFFRLGDYDDLGKSGKKKKD